MHGYNELMMRVVRSLAVRDARPGCRLGSALLARLALGVVLAWGGISMQAQLIMPATITIASKQYELRYAIGSETNRQTTAGLYDETGAQGQALLVFQPGQTIGTAAIGEKRYSLLFSPTATNIIQLPALPIPPSGKTDSVADPDDRPLPRRKTVTAADAGGIVVVDLMVVYSPAAKAAMGGVSNILNRITLSIAEANQTYIDTGINVRLNLVYTGEISFTETASMDSDLSWLRSNSTVLSLQTQYHADVVSLFNHAPGSPYAGIGYILTGSSQLAYNVVQAQYAIGHYVLAHEVGHNFGCAHDRANSDGYAAFSYSYGATFRANNVTWGTVMAYPGTRIGMFSSPIKTYLGVATGTATEDNARTINERAADIAAIKSAPTYTLNVAVNGTGSIAKDGISVSPGNFTVPRGSVSLTASGDFVCWSGATNSTAATVQVSVLTQDAYMVANFADGTAPVAPQVSLQPQSQALRPGETLNLSADGIGTPAPAFQWEFNGNIIGSGKTLTITNVTSADQGNYRCILNSASGSATSAVAVVLVGIPPGITQQPADQFAAIGGATTFTVTSDSPGVTYQWYFNGTPIASATRSAFSIAHVAAQDAGAYSVVVTGTGLPGTK